MCDHVWNEDGETLVVGGHFDDVHKEPLTLAKSLIEPLKSEGVKSIDLYVFGGETGRISVGDDNIVDGPTMDYTEYYSFLEALVRESSGTFVSYNLPSNNGTTTTGAAIRLSEKGDVEVKLWTKKKK